MCAERSGDQVASASLGVEEPPRTFAGILRRLGPGLIIAGSIVGSGELVATTSVGAQAGMWLFWLILIGCVIKVFAQVELGRHTIASGATTIDSMNSLPGPRIPGHGNWLVWYWLAMFLVSLGQLGGIVGGVGQAMAISWPLTGEGRRFNAIVDAELELQVKERYLDFLDRSGGQGGGDTRAKAAALEADVALARQRIAELGSKPDGSRDDRIWAAIITAITAVLLVVGRYRFVEVLSTVLVATFTLVTVGTVILLQLDDSLAISPSELADGLSFRLPPRAADSAAEPGFSPLATALKTFGIIGVGASELVAYPYWCLEKGYARFTGPRDGSAAWAERARGWLRVLRWDAWVSMVVYTAATAAFYVLGAATLGRFGLHPRGQEMVRTLAVMYEPVFGSWAPILFLFGAFAVLYSTFFVAIAGHARVCADSLRVFGFPAHSAAARLRRTRIFSGIFPFLALCAYLFYREPTALILASGLMQAMMLPMLAGAAIYYRRRVADPRIAPGRVWDILLWLSAAGMLVAGAGAAYLAFD